MAKPKSISQIFVVDDMPTEANAMLQALYSRSPRSVTEHLEKVKKTGAEKFMASFYVGYGHKSIGDCGTTSLFIEYISMLTAKAIQDWPLYSGQEASTRYLDMTNQPVLNPLGTPAGQAVQDEWLKLYRELLEELLPVFTKRFPIEPGQDEKIYFKAVKARVFDVARGFLPAGMTTFVAWHTNLRQANDHLKWLRHHPLEEVRSVAKQILASLKAKYQSSFLHEQFEADEKYLEDTAKKTTYFDDPSITDFKVVDRLNRDEVKNWLPVLAKRPAKSELPPQARECGDLVVSLPLDFGSFRDLQRQRSCVQKMPLLTTNHGFHSWYLEQLPDNLRQKAQKVIDKQIKAIGNLKTTPEIAQYYTAMGFLVSCKMTMNLASAIYVAELRSAQTVHPTLRVHAQALGDAIKKLIPEAAMHHDMSEDAWNIKRGTQDIVRK